MSKIFIVLFSVSFFTIGLVNLHAQSLDAFVLSGVILDEESGDPLSYASLAIQNTSFGTIANEYGEFRLTLSRELLNDTLVFSYVGYAKQIRLLSGLKPGVAIKILLQQEPTLLSEVSIESIRLDAHQIMEKAVAAIRENYPSSAFVMEGFFRELIREDEKYVELTESVIRVFDKNFQRRLNHGITEEVCITQGRRSVSYADPIVRRVRKQNSIMDLLDNNPVHFTRGLLNTKYFDYKIDSVLQTGKKLIFIISTIPGGHQIYVSDSSYAILKTIEKITPMDTVKRPEFNLDDSLLVRRMAYFKAITEFQAYHGKMFLKYSNETDAYEIIYRSTRKLKFLVESHKEFVVTNIIESRAEPFPKNERFNFRDDLISKPYNHSFWNENLSVQLSPLSRRARKDLEQKMPLLDQFVKTASGK
jgi:hypothetical protein